MPKPRFASPLPAATSETTTTCPGLADLIDYALGRATPLERQRIEDHLQLRSCSHCQAWVEQAARFRQEPNVGEKNLASGPAKRPAFPSSLPSVSDRTPVPENAKWQGQVFRDLEKRLRLLEEE